MEAPVSQSLRVSRIQFAALVDTALWRALAFARSLQGRSPWVARQLRRAVLLLWWTATLQLHIHARYWLRARRLRRAAPVAAPAPVVDTFDPQTLAIPCSDEPIVSVIIPTFGQVSFTLRCLASIAEHVPTLPIEVIVVDDAWKGADTACLAHVQGIRLIRNEANLGFLHSCNKAADAAKGQYLLFLNNDTQVLPGWLEPMVALFRQRPDTGAVGAKLLYPDGRLQEAGGIIWQDASGWNFGRLEDPSKPVYNYVREVDYCSGAALMVERAIYARLGGFDPIYAPAYFEDSDLCFRLRRIGLKTLYQPASRVIHHEGISHGCDTAVGIKSYQVTNRRIFINRWGDTLVDGHYRNGHNVFRARDRAMHRNVVLVVDHYVPTPDRDAGSRTVMAFMDIMLDTGFVVKFWPHNLSYSPGYTETLQSWGSRCCTVLTRLHSRPGSRGPAASLMQCWSAGRTSPRTSSRRSGGIRGHGLSITVTICISSRMRLQAELTGDERLLRAARHMRSRERSIWRQADLSLYPSEDEAAVAATLEADAAIGTITPYFFDQCAAPRCAPVRREIIFIAGFGHPPNEDGAVWFVNAILPLIRAEIPEIDLSIIGSNPTDCVQDLAGDGIAVFANVSDAELAAAYDRARVAVVPLRCGAGVKLKTVEALRSGVPLVTTQVGAQGLAGLSSVVAVEDDPVRFAAAVVEMLRDDAAWEMRCQAQIDYVRQRFSRNTLTLSLRAALTATLPDSASRGWMAAE